MSTKRKASAPGVAAVAPRLDQKKKARKEKEAQRLALAIKKNIELYKIFYYVAAFILLCGLCLYAFLTDKFK